MTTEEKEALELERINLRSLARTRRTFGDAALRAHLSNMIARLEVRLIAATETLRTLDTH